LWKRGFEEGKEKPCSGNCGFGQTVGNRAAHARAQYFGFQEPQLAYRLIVANSIWSWRRVVGIGRGLVGQGAGFVESGKNVVGGYVLLAERE
jgi:hypothetical protein